MTFALQFGLCLSRQHVCGFAPAFAPVASPRSAELVLSIRAVPASPRANALQQVRPIMPSLRPFSPAVLFPLTADCRTTNTGLSKIDGAMRRISVTVCDGPEDVTLIARLSVSGGTS